MDLFSKVNLTDCQELEQWADDEQDYPEDYSGL